VKCVVLDDVVYYSTTIKKTKEKLFKLAICLNKMYNIERLTHKYQAFYLKLAHFLNFTMQAGWS
jgi:hypothetical protein